MHILPQLRKLERKYRDWLVVVGVHSSKFPNEKETGNLRNAVLRYGIEHPVVNDHEFILWQEYGVRAWPTLMFVDPQGKIVGKHEGEFELAKFDALISDMGAEFRSLGLLNETPLPYQLEAAKAEARPLSFPGKIEVDAGRLFIADSGHNRVLVTNLEGEVQTIIGSGEHGNSDGAFDSAMLNHPQGMAVDGNRLYIADAENHTIRLADLDAGALTTIAGTGEQALFRHEGGLATEFPLNSPYDLAFQNGTLYVAMAGFHQLWELDLPSGQIGPYAGDGIENILDGPRMEARLAQPYGLTASGGMIYFADSETSAVRAVPGIDVDTELAMVETLIGDGLFDFGDRDGAFGDAILQHVQATAVMDDVLYIADSYNHKIKAMDLENRVVETVAGSGDSGATDGGALEAAFNEPAGLACADRQIYVADTNSHAIRVIDLDTEQVSTLELTGLPGNPE
ncbi:MAG: alkyl hydroperoxide reductase [Chloroflexi bacterium]|nr:alkyl hydroperoxide reductase [Chloroflexota bacterium]